MSVGVEVLWWLCLLVVFYVYALYPALLYLLSRWLDRPIRRGSALPTMTVLVPVFNEELRIAEKIANTLALDYPQDRLELQILSDGSTDRSEEIARTLAGPQLTLVVLPRGGKATALNEGASRARGEILVLTDANSSLEPDALRRLAECFNDPEVGGVCGNKKQRPRPGSDATAAGEGLYWRYDKWQKSLESRLGSIFAADGTLYAVRRSLYVPIVDPAQADDIAISARVVMQGARLVYEPRAVAWEDEPEEGMAEFRRKIRVTNHSVRALLNLGPALWNRGLWSWELLSHKLLRHLVPLFLVPLFGLTLLLLPRPFYLAAAAAQVLFYLLAALGLLLRRSPHGQRPWLTVPYYFCLVNGAALLGVLAILRGRRIRAWAPRGS